MERGRKSCSFSPLPPRKTNNRRSVSNVESEKIEKQTSDALYDILMKDPRKRAIVLQILSQEKETIRECMKKTTVTKNVRAANCESPTALYRRRALEKVQKRPGNESDSSESSDIRQIVVQTPIPLAELLTDVIAFVEVKTKKGDSSEAIKAMLRAMGATVRDVFTRDVTHVVFKDGSFKTYQKARLLKTHLVSLLWIEAVKTTHTRVPEKNFPALGTEVYSGEVSIICQQMQKEYEEALRDEYNRSVLEESPTNNHFKERRKTALPSELLASRKKSSRSSSSSRFVPNSQDEEVRTILERTRLFSRRSSSSSNDSRELPEVDVVEETPSTFNSDKSDCLIDGEVVNRLVSEIDLSCSLGDRAMRSIENVSKSVSDKNVSDATSNGSTSLLNRKSVQILKGPDRRQKSDCYKTTEMDLTRNVASYLIDNRKSVGAENCIDLNSMERDSSATLSFDKLINLEHSEPDRTDKNRPRESNKKVHVDSLETDELSSLRLSESSSDARRASQTDVNSPSKRKSDTQMMISSDKEANISSGQKRKRSAVESLLTENMSSLRLSANSDSNDKLSPSPLKHKNKMLASPSKRLGQKNVHTDSENSPAKPTVSLQKATVKRRVTKKLVNNLSDDESFSGSDISPKNGTKISTKSKRELQPRASPPKQGKIEDTTKRVMPVRASRKKTVIQNNRSESENDDSSSPSTRDDLSSSSSDMDWTGRAQIKRKTAKKLTPKRRSERIKKIASDETSADDDAKKKRVKRKLYDPSEPVLSIPPERVRGVTPIRDETRFKQPLVFFTPVMMTSRAKSFLNTKSATVGRARKTPALDKVKEAKPKPPPKSAPIKRATTKPDAPVSSTPLRRSRRISDVHTPVDTEVTPVQRRSTLDFMSVSENEKWMKRSPLKKASFGIVCTRLHKPEVEVFAQVVKKLGGFLIEDEVSMKTTHLVAGDAKRTVNLLRAIARGCWVLKQEWVLKSLEAEKWLPEEDFELTEFSPAVMQCRIERQAFGWNYSMNIFRDCGYIYIARGSIPRCSDMEDLVKLCKGKVTKAIRRAQIVVGEKVDFEGVISVKEVWILDSIMENRLKPVKSYLMPQHQHNFV